MEQGSIQKYFRRKEEIRTRNGRDPKERDSRDSFRGPQYQGGIN
jgi:hypothetical protein